LSVVEVYAFKSQFGGIYALIGLVYSIQGFHRRSHRKMIEASQRMTRQQNNVVV
jgi:hypothetical protein